MQLPIVAILFVALVAGTLAFSDPNEDKPARGNLAKDDKVSLPPPSPASHRAPTYHYLSPLSHPLQNALQAPFVSHHITYSNVTQHKPEP